MQLPKFQGAAILLALCHYTTKRQGGKSMNKREQILNLLEEYPELVRKAALLRYELRRPSTLSPSDMIDAMNFC